MHSEYEFEVDEFDGHKYSAAFFNYKSCKLAEAEKGFLHGASFSYSSHPTYEEGPILAITKKSQGVDLALFPQLDEVPAVVTYKGEGRTENTELKVEEKLKYFTAERDMVYESFSVVVPVWLTSRLPRVASIEFWYETAKIWWRPNTHALLTASLSPEPDPVL